MKNKMAKLITMAICALCVSSAKGALMAQWTSGTLQPLGWGVSAASPVLSTDPDFTFTYTEPFSGSLPFTVTLAPGYSAENVNLVINFTIAGKNVSTGQPTTVNGTPYSAEGSYSQTLTPTFNSGTSTYSSTFSFSGAKGTLTFDTVVFNGTVVPEPTDYALAGFGLMFVGGIAGRRLLARRQPSA
jgi:hypothetical protein